MRRAGIVGAVEFAALSVGTGVAGAVPAATAPSSVVPASISGCQDTKAPSWFTHDSVAVAKDSSVIPDSWGADENWARIACYESSYRVTAANGQYHGLGQMSQASVTGVGVSWSAYLNGTSTHAKSWYQIQAALKYAKSRYGSPAAGWAHEKSSGWW